MLSACPIAARRRALCGHLVRAQGRAGTRSCGTAPGAMKKNRDVTWEEAVRRCRLDPEAERMARELGLQPKSLVRVVPGPNERWKATVSNWVRHLISTVVSCACSGSARKRSASVWCPTAVRPRSCGSSTASASARRVDWAGRLWPATSRRADGAPQLAALLSLLVRQRRMRSFFDYVME